MKTAGGWIFCLLLVAATTSAQEQSGLLERLTGKPGKRAEPVEPEKAFSVGAKRAAPNRVVVDFSVRPEYYLYRERLLIGLKDSPGQRIKQLDLPPATMKDDKTFGRSAVYTRSFSVPVEIDGSVRGPTTLLVRYQGCYETLGVCYPPVTTTLTVAR